MDTLVYSPLRKNQALATKKLLPCQCTVTAISHTIQPKPRWRMPIARIGSIKPAKKFLEKFSTIKGFNESAITAKLLRHRHQFFFRQMVIENIIDCQFLCGGVLDSCYNIWWLPLFIRDFSLPFPLVTLNVSHSRVIAWGKPFLS